MKREEVVAGAEYATDLGVRVRIEPETPGEDGAVPIPSAGWAVKDGEWVQEEDWGLRLLKDGSHKRYLSNVSLRATEVDTGTKIVVEPRRLTLPWDEHVKAMHKAVEQREALETNAEALRLRAERAKVRARTDLRKREVHVSFDDFDTLLRKARV